MTDLTPEQEAAAMAALEEKETRSRARKIQVRPGAFERNHQAVLEKRAKSAQEEVLPPTPAAPSAPKTLLQKLKSLFAH